MTIRWLLAAVHLLALGLGIGAIWARGRALRGELDAAGLRRAFYADTWWGIAAVLWIGTGLARAFGGFEKGSVYYLHNHAFWAKLTLLAAILILEVGPMIEPRAGSRGSASSRPHWWSSWCWLPRPWRVATAYRRDERGPGLSPQRL